MTTKPNRLYFGDCLEVMREDIPSESVDLIYLDPPFNSKRIYNAFIGGAQWVAFDDTWHWYEAIDDFYDVLGDVNLGRTMEGLQSILGEGPSLAYLSYMANRLRECYRVLKSTGTIYLHCDPTMSHYLKIVIDGIFGAQNFRNEVVWCYRGGGVPKLDFARRHDILFRYGKGREITFNVDAVRIPYSEDTAERLRYKARSFRPNKTYDNYEQHPEGKHPEDWWEIQPIMPSSKERLGYPTQKPRKLLERIIQASSNPGDLVLDPFCGCGTTAHVAQDIGRPWVGIDICVTACQVIQNRLSEHFAGLMTEFIGFPKTVSDAKQLANLDKFRFERWAASLVDGMEANSRQRGDGGIDGRGRIALRRGEFIDMVSQVKGGGTGPGDVQAFNGARQQAGAELGVFTCFVDRVTNGMRDAAASAGRFKDTPVIQIYTVEDYFAGRKPELPRVA